MNTISHYMGADHTRCNALFEESEVLVGQARWEQAAMAFEHFCEALERHFSMEENVLFLAFEEATGSGGGPTSVMRLEHQHIRGIVSRLADAVRQRDANDFFGHADTLRIMLQQHNLKEESVLYVMTDRALSGRNDEIIDAMDAVDKFGMLGAADMIK